MADLYNATSQALDRLGDLANDIWSREEVEEYLIDGYDTFCSRAKPLFDVLVIPNVPPTGNWQSDLEKYFIQQQAGWGYTDSPFFYTDPDGRPERDLSGQFLGPQAVGATNQGAATMAVEQDIPIPTEVHGGYLPQSVVEVVRVSYDQKDLMAFGSQQMRRMDSNYETKAGDPQFFTYDKDGLFFLRVIPAAGGDAVYPVASGGFGTLTQVQEEVTTIDLPTPTNYWKMEDADGANTVLDSVGTENLLVLTGPIIQAGGKNAFGTKLYISGHLQAPVSFTAANTVATWLRIDENGGIVRFGSNNGVTRTWVELDFSGVFRLSTNNGPSDVLGTTPIVEGTFYHVVLVWDGVNTHRLYVNGVLDATMTTVASNGGLNCFTTSGAQATFDETVRFGEAFDATQVATLYNAGAGVFYDAGAWFQVAASELVVTTEVTGATTGGFGVLRALTDSDETEAHPSGGPWGTPTQLHPEAINLQVEVFRLGRSLRTHDFEIPRAYQKYVIYWAMARALRRDGPGQDMALADHYEQRFEMGVTRIIRKRERMQPERIGRLGGSGVTDPFGLGMPLLPTAYENPWSR